MKAMKVLSQAVGMTDSNGEDNSGSGESSNDKGDNGENGQAQTPVVFNGPNLGFNFEGGPSSSVSSSEYGVHSTAYSYGHSPLLYFYFFPENSGESMKQIIREQASHLSPDKPNESGSDEQEDSSGNENNDHSANSQDIDDQSSDESSVGPPQFGGYYLPAIPVQQPRQPKKKQKVDQSDEEVRRSQPQPVVYIMPPPLPTSKQQDDSGERQKPQWPPSATQGSPKPSYYRIQQYAQQVAQHQLAPQQDSDSRETGASSFHGGSADDHRQNFGSAFKDFVPSMNKKAKVDQSYEEGRRPQAQPIVYIMPPPPPTSKPQDDSDERQKPQWSPPATQGSPQPSYYRIQQYAQQVAQQLAPQQDSDSRETGASSLHGGNADDHRRNFGSAFKGFGPSIKATKGTRQKEERKPKGSETPSYGYPVLPQFQTYGDYHASREPMPQPHHEREKQVSYYKQPTTVAPQQDESGERNIVQQSQAPHTVQYYPPNPPSAQQYRGGNTFESQDRWRQQTYHHDDEWVSPISVEVPSRLNSVDDSTEVAQSPAPAQKHTTQVWDAPQYPPFDNSSHKPQKAIYRPPGPPPVPDDQYRLESPPVDGQQSQERQDFEPSPIPFWAQKSRQSQKEPGYQPDFKQKIPRPPKGYYDYKIAKTQPASANAPEPPAYKGGALENELQTVHDIIDASMSSEQLQGLVSRGAYQHTQGRQGAFFGGSPKDHAQNFGSAFSDFGPSYSQQKVKSYSPTKQRNQQETAGSFPQSPLAEQGTVSAAQPAVNAVEASGEEAGSRGHLSLQQTYSIPKTKSYEQTHPVYVVVQDDPQLKPDSTSVETSQGFASLMDNFGPMNSYRGVQFGLRQTKNKNNAEVGYTGSGAVRGAQISQDQPLPQSGYTFQQDNLPPSDVLESSAADKGGASIHGASSAEHERNYGSSFKDFGPSSQAERYEADRHHGGSSNEHAENYGSSFKAFGPSRFADEAAETQKKKKYYSRPRTTPFTRLVTPVPVLDFFGPKDASSEKSTTSTGNFQERYGTAEPHLSRNTLLVNGNLHN